MRTVLPAGKVTTVLTSCGRWDLLSETIGSFLDHHEPGRFLVAEDSGDADFAGRIATTFPMIEVLLNDPRLGQHRSIDRAYGMVETPFILHLEDDWRCDGPMHVEQAAALLGERSELSGVCFRRFRELKLTHRMFARRFTHDGIDYADMRSAHRDWYGYSFNPSLVRRESWGAHGPLAKYANERVFSRHMKDQGLSVAFQLPGVASHIGSGRSVFDPQRAGERRRAGNRPAGGR